MRGQEAAIGNLIADAIREAVGAEIAITNGGGIRADKEYPAGTELTRGDIFAELPFGNQTVKLEITGEKLKEALENGLSPGREGRRPLPAGLRHDRRGRPFEAGRRARDRRHGRRRAARPGEDLHRSPPTTSWRTAATATRPSRTRRTLIEPADAQLMASQVIDYIAAKKTVAPAVEGRIKM